MGDFQPHILYSGRKFTVRLKLMRWAIAPCPPPHLPRPHRPSLISRPIKNCGFVVGPFNRSLLHFIEMSDRIINVLQTTTRRTSTAVYSESWTSWSDCSRIQTSSPYSAAAPEPVRNSHCSQAISGTMICFNRSCRQYLRTGSRTARLLTRNTNSCPWTCIKLKTLWKFS